MRASRTFNIALACSVAMCSISASAAAQSTFSTITTDTGEFAPGHRDFQRYTTPLSCLVASHNAEATAKMRLTARAHFDSLEHQPARDTQPTTVVAITRACAVRFSLAATAPHDLPLLFGLALRVGNDTLAHAVVTRRLELATTAAERTRIRLLALSAFLGVHAIDDSAPGFAEVAEPANLSAATAVMREIETSPSGPTGPTAAVSDMLTRLQAHGVWLQFYERSEDTAQVRQEAERMLALWHEVTPPAHGSSIPGTDLVIDAYRALMAIAVEETPLSTSPAITALAQRVHTDFTKLPNPPRLENGLTIATAPLPTLIEWLAPLTYVAVHRDLRMSPMTWTYRFPVPINGSSARDTSETGAPSAPARVFLWIWLSPWCSYDYRVGARSGCWGNEASAVRRWLTEFGSYGLDVTVVTSTRGGLLWEGAVSPAREAERARWFVQDYHQLPVAVAVREAHFHVLPQPDGRRVDIGDSTWTTNTSNWIVHLVPGLKDRGREFSGSSGVLLTDTSGRVLLASGWWPRESGMGGARLDDIDPVVTRILRATLGSSSRSTSPLPHQ